MQETVLKTRNSTSGLRVLPLSICYSKEQGKLLAGGCDDGSIQIWAENGLTYRPEIWIK
jgi:hypothetical protein